MHCPRAQLSLAYHRQSIAASRFSAHLQRSLRRAGGQADKDQA